MIVLDPESLQSLDCLFVSSGNTESRLHHVGLSLMNRTTCEDKWGGGLITDSHICAHPAGSASCLVKTLYFSSGFQLVVGGATFVSISCHCLQGDSGAPLYCRKRNAYFLFGMITWGSRRCDADKPSVFTGTSDYHAWISDVIEDY